MKCRMLFITLALLVMLSEHSSAYISRIYSLQEVLNESTNVLSGKIEKVDRKRRTAVALIERAMKGKKEYQRVQMNIALGPSSQAKYLLDRWQPGDPFLLFYRRSGNSIASIGHAGDTWFQLFAGHNNDWKKVWWRFSHLEIYMGRTYNGTTKELIKVTDDVLAKRVAPPKPDPRVPKLDIRNPPTRVARTAPSRTGASSQSSKVLITKGSTWKYLKGMREASNDKPKHAAWRSVKFSDSKWASGRAPFGYGDGPFGTTLDDTKKAGYTCLFMRQKFSVNDPAAVGNLELNVNYDDGFIIWINGKEAAAVNKPKGKFTYKSLAAAQHESGKFETFTVSDPRRLLVSGTNVIALQTFNIGLTSSDLKMDVEMKVGLNRSEAGFRRTLVFKHGGSEIRGISWTDINGDEQPDIYLCRGQSDLLLLNDGGSFTDATKRFGLSRGSRAAAWADYNGDDHPDLLTNNFQLFTNEGGKLRNDSKLIPAPKQRNPEGAGWIDYNGDGLLDILITNGEHGILLFENTGKGPNWFRDVSNKALLGSKGIGKGNGDFVVFADYDGDGYTDFFYNLGKGVLAHNEGDGTFKLDTQSGIELPGGSNYKRGVAFADYDNDGDLDLFVPAPGKARLYRNNNDGSFSNVIDGSGDLAKSTMASFAAAWADVNNDGSLDLVVCHTQGPSRLYLGNGKGKFQDVTTAVGLGELTPAYGASFADIDDDGDLDLAVNLENRVVLKVNEMSRRANYAPLKVRVQTRKGLVGAIVRVFDQKGKPLGMRELNGAESCGGQASPTAHFGLPVGQCRTSVCLSDGRVAQKTVTIKRNGTTLVLLEKEFE